MKEFFKVNWSILFCKNIFRIFPTDLTNEEKRKRSQYCLKLTCLSESTIMVNLKEIINRIKAKSYFISKNRFLADYKKERFT
jgi:hypothetical protein